MFDYSLNGDSFIDMKLYNEVLLDIFSTVQQFYDRHNEPKNRFWCINQRHEHRFIQFVFNIDCLPELTFNEINVMGENVYSTGESGPNNYIRGVPVCCLFVLFRVYYLIYIPFLVSMCVLGVCVLDYFSLKNYTGLSYAE